MWTDALRVVKEYLPHKVRVSNLVVSRRTRSCVVGLRICFICVLYLFCVMCL